MRIRMMLLAIGCPITCGLLVAVSYQPHAPVTAHKTDRLVGEKAPAGFLSERFG
ncbi:hypothetical protein [Rhizobium sp. GCM10022189]|uniref:hypothetical protein n=1 Tax=Rhizobium sp. GCM10022189 TaxID=3252654 RepID=UPI003623301F